MEATTAEPVGAGSRRGVLTVALAIAVAHGLNDTYAAFLHPLLPRIMEKLGLSITLAAVLATTLALAASLLQPVMGYVADRGSRRVFVVLGPLMSAVFLSLIGVAPSFTILVLLLSLGGLGSALFHPPAASIAVRVTEGGGSGLRYSVFSFGGALGYAAGPVVAVSIVATFGLERLWLAMIPMLLLAPLLIRVLPAVDGKAMTAAPSLSSILRLLRGPLGLVFGISALSTFVQRVFLTMEPIAANAAGASEAVGALTLSVYLAGQAAGSLMGGWLTDRIDRRRLIMGLTMASMPLHAMAIFLEAGSSGAFTAAFFAGSASMALLPPVVVIAQEIMPGGAALGSGIVMGLAWAAGSLGVLPAGVLGDVVGARSAALLCTPVVLGATMLAMSPSLDPHRRPHR